MPNDKTLSKFLSLVLRHDPGVANVTLDPAGWVSIDTLIQGSAQSGVSITPLDLDRVARESDKQRFTISPDGKRIRAAQGHSVDIDLGLEPVTPPETLFHGTAERTLDAILTEGLKPQARQHVHLSPDVETARTVGMRHGKPVVLTVASGAAHRAGQIFWQSENGVWLTGPMAPEYLTT